MREQDKPKEFWIYEFGQDVFEFKVDNNDIIHVIEISALEQAQQEISALRSELLAARESLNKYIDDENWIDRNRKSGWNEAVYIKSMGEMKEYAKAALSRIDKFLKGGLL